MEASCGFSARALQPVYQQVLKVVMELHFSETQHSLVSLHVSRLRWSSLSLFLRDQTLESPESLRLNLKLSM